MPLLSLSGQRPRDLGVQDGRLKPCPNSPNCVCSYETDAAHGIDPLEVPGEASEAIARLRTVVEAMPRTQVIEARADYLYVEFTTALMGFVDDVEFYLDGQRSGIQVRSASRLGQSDLGANRSRVEEIRKRLAALL
ncbi:DUF1499 domain-containing protein [Lyngbya confervoides]|uniref:DUF1499 domain-containing protein n=1 Tax=Lyngbya confervoides BDU141951 TaxID=1574623 RepID=A0ABD4T627_9CYAN|nr:DUF1499 domain-containing protein [Lyngbya confervoides]MCM1983727.1 DUF1499 domain-containing protein [Lyngbya confervoides BDU141951]